MNGIHDMGGMQDMGPIRAEKDEPVFHAAWEKRTFALYLSIDETNRYDLELTPPAEYLRMSYYDRWLTSIAEVLKKNGLATQAEIDSGKSLGGKITGRHVYTVAEAAAMIKPGSLASDARAVTPALRFQIGQRIRARNINPLGHTRLPRYVRGKIGTIERVCGVEPLWDKDAQGIPIDKKPRPVYSVRFAARELWGDQENQRDSIYVDVWEDYLEPG